MDVLFVCTGNTCRSPMAEAFLREALAERGVEGILVSSAGIHAAEGAPASSHALKAARALGADLRPHRARQLTEEIAQNALVLGMTPQHVKIARLIAPGARAELLSEFVGGSGAVDDPYGGSLDDYRAAALVLHAYARQLAERAARGGRLE